MDSKRDGLGESKGGIRGIHTSESAYPPQYQYYPQGSGIRWEVHQITLAITLISHTCLTLYITCHIHHIPCTHLCHIIRIQQILIQRVRHHHHLLPSRAIVHEPQPPILNPLVGSKVKNIDYLKLDALKYEGDSPFEYIKAVKMMSWELMTINPFR